MNHPWGRPVTDHGDGWAVIDVETSGFHPNQARVISVAALALPGDVCVVDSVEYLIEAIGGDGQYVVELMLEGDLDG